MTRVSLIWYCPLHHQFSRESDREGDDVDDVKAPLFSSFSLECCFASENKNKKPYFLPNYKVEISMTSAICGWMVSSPWRGLPKRIPTGERFVNQSPSSVIPVGFLRSRGNCNQQHIILDDLSWVSKSTEQRSAC
jgi:hypothetical protein